MKRLLPLLMLATLPAWSETEPRETLSRFQVRQLLRQARNLYNDDEVEPEALEETARAFALAAEHGEPGEVNLDAVRFAEAMAWMRANQPERALEAFERIQGFPRADERARHRFHRGNAHLAAGENALSGEDFDTAKEQMSLAIENYIASLLEEPGAEPTKQNLEIARRRLQFVEENAPPPPSVEPEPGEDEDQEEQDPGEEPPPPQPGEEGEEGEDPDPQPQPQPDPEPGDEDDTDAPGEEAEQDPADGDPADATPDLVEDVEGEAPRDDPDLEDLTEDEARRTLDWLFEQERRQREDILRNRHRHRAPVEKDW